MNGDALDPETHPTLSVDQIGVLVAEDDALLRADMARALSAAGIAAFGVGDADEAVRALAWRTDIRVLITDVGMPSGGVNGFQLSALVAARWPQIGILIVSGRGRPQAGDLPMGVRFLPKPCRDQDLVAAVFGFVSRQTGAI